MGECWVSYLTATTGDDPMTEHTSGDPNAVDRLVRLDDGDIHVAEEGNPDAPGKSTTPAGKAGYAITAQARRVGAVLDRLGVSTVTVVGHSSGCAVATALAEQRPDVVADLALIDFGPSLAAKTPEKLLFRLLLTPVSRAATVAPANWGHDPQGRACRLHPTRGHPRCLH
jgi:pimeloyl-ACP methyl ester carboxylesterase